MRQQFDAESEMPIVVTGAGGFAASHLCDLLLGSGRMLVALISPSDSLSNLEHIRNKLEICRGDICDFAFISDVVEKFVPSRVFHLASISTKGEQRDDLRKFHDVIVGGTLNLLLALRKSSPAARFVYISSSEVYGPWKGIVSPINELAPVEPRNIYSSAKAASELVALQFHRSYDLPVICVRSFQHTGPRQRADFVCSSLARQFAEVELGLRDYISAGDLDVSRDFTDVRDVVRGYNLLMEHGAVGQVYNVCSGSATSLQSVVEELSALSHTRPLVRSDHTLRRATEVRSYWGDPSKIKRDVRWRPEIPLSRTLRDMLEYWKLRLQATSACW